MAAFQLCPWHRPSNNATDRVLIADGRFQIGYLHVSYHCNASRARRRGDQLNRRAFIALLGGAAVWPLAARAQQPKVPVIGFLERKSARDAGQMLAAFHRGGRVYRRPECSD
jgi:hypothetical protein